MQALKIQFGSKWRNWWITFAVLTLLDSNVQTDYGLRYPVSYHSPADITDMSKPLGAKRGWGGLTWVINPSSPSCCPAEREHSVSGQSGHSRKEGLRLYWPSVPPRTRKNVCIDPHGRSWLGKHLFQENQRRRNCLQAARKTNPESVSQITMHYLDRTDSCISPLEI